MAVKQLTIKTKASPEQSAHVSRMLAVNNIDIRAVNVYRGEDCTVFRLICSDPVTGARVLTAKGDVVAVEDVLAVEVPDVPGGFAKVMDILEQSGIKIDYLYSSLEKHKDRAVIIIKTPDLAEAVKVLESRRLKLVGKF